MLSSGIPTSQPLALSRLIPFSELQIFTHAPWHRFPHQGQELALVEQLFRKTGKFNFAKGGRPHIGIWIEEKKVPWLWAV
jgi:hypothetical protein